MPHHSIFLLNRIGFIFLTVLLGSCTFPQIGYVTPTHQMPLHTGSREVNLMGTAGWNHVEAQMSISPVKHLGLMANVYHNLASRTSNEIGLGYYTLTHKKWMCEFYNLYNNTKLYYLNETGSSTGQADRMDCAYEGGSTQFDIGYIRPGENLFLHSVAFGVKYSHVKYSLFEFDEGYGTNFNPQYTLHLGNPNYDFLAISNTTRFRFPNLCTILVQPSYHLNLNHGNREKQLSPFYSDFWLTLGFEIRYVLPRNRPVED